VNKLPQNNNYYRMVRFVLLQNGLNAKKYFSSDFLVYVFYAILEESMA